MEMIARLDFPDSADISKVTTCNLSDDEEDDSTEKPPPTLLLEILRALVKTRNGSKWFKITSTELYVHKLCSAEEIAKSFYAYELDEIAKVLSQLSSCKLMFPKSSSKHTKVNIISKYFGDKSVWYPKKKTIEV